MSLEDWAAGGEGVFEYGDYTVTYAKGRGARYAVYLSPVPYRVRVFRRLDRVAHYLVGKHASTGHIIGRRCA